MTFTGVGSYAGLSPPGVLGFARRLHRLQRISVFGGTCSPQTGYAPSVRTRLNAEKTQKYREDVTHALQVRWQFCDGSQHQVRRRLRSTSSEPQGFSTLIR